MRARRPRDGEAPERPAVSVRTAALNLLARREYTAKELRAKLAGRGYEAGEIDDTVTSLAANRWQDDRRVALAHARTAAGPKGRGKYRIERELTARGVSKELAKEVVASVTPADEVAAIEVILRRKRIGRVSSPAERRRVFQHLIRRGFGSDSILKALRKHGAEPEDVDLD